MYIGAENIISPIGNSATQNFEKLQKGISGIELHKNVGFDNKDLFLSKINDDSFNKFLLKFDALLIQSISDTLLQIKHTPTPSQEGNVPDQFLNNQSSNLIVIISSTKGNIDKLNTENEDYSLVESAKTIQEHFKLKNTPLIISNACISGVMAINTANNLIENNIYKHAIECGWI